MTAAAATPRAEIVVDLGAIRHNVRRLRELVSTDDAAPALMVVVKADGYGHGMVESARAAREGGAEWLGVATVDEAVALRAAGDTRRILCWLAVPGEDLGPAIAADVDVTAYSVAQLEEIVALARGVGRTARLQLKVDTGLSRGGAPRDQWSLLFEAARKVEVAGDVEVVGVWSHFACSDVPDHPANDAQEDAFREALDLATRSGLTPEVCHLSNSAGALLRPSSRFDLVRLGIASYGLTPAPDVVSSDELGLVPAMTVRASVVLAKDIEAGAGVSYGHAFVADRPMRVALVPLGYGDGVPRHASSTASVQLGGERAPVLGRVCMDQFVVGAPHAEAGDDVVLFGPGSDGEPTAQDWAEWCGTISYEIVTRMRGRQHRRWIDGETGA
jgi:alanine racemase